MQDHTSSNRESDTQTSAQLEENLFHYLTGYGRGRPDLLAQIIDYQHWQARAQAEVERRMTELVERIDIETLTAMAEGRIDIAQVAKRVLDAR
jgi:hypothetical protein